MDTILFDLKSDIKGAKDFGLKTIWINRGNKVNKVNKGYKDYLDVKGIIPDYEISDLSEIFNVLKA